MAFCRLLRLNGLVLGPGDAVDALRALELVDLGDRAEVYWTLRALLVRSVDQVPTFDLAYRLFWSGVDAGRGRGGRTGTEGLQLPSDQLPRGLPQRRAVEPGSRRQPEDGAPDRDGAEVRPAVYSPVEVLGRLDFAELDLAEVEAMLRATAELARRLATRTSRRTRPARRGGSVDLRRSMRRALGTGGEVLELRRRLKKLRRTTIVLLCDVSGSMNIYSRFLLHFMYGLQLNLRRLESFVFATRLTRVTDCFRGRDSRRALDAVAEAVTDWSGGTRIGACLARFNRDFGSSLLGPRTVVLILSDGLDTGEPDLLRREMARLSRGAGQVIWLNPLAGDPRYEPLCQGMRAALPYVDVLAPAHSLESLLALDRHLGTPSGRPGQQRRRALRLTGRVWAAGGGPGRTASGRRRGDVQGRPEEGGRPCTRRFAGSRP